MKIKIIEIEADAKEVKESNIFKKELKNVDTVKIVRCNDCPYYNGHNKWCDCAVAQNEGYCSYGYGESKETMK